MKTLTEGLAEKRVKTWQERWKEYTCGDRLDVKQDCMQAEIDELRKENAVQREALEQAIMYIVLEGGKLL